MRRVATMIGVVIALAAGTARAEPVHLGKAAPDATFALDDGTTRRLSEQRGQIVILNFWATWCVPCRAELPLLDAFARAHAADGVQVLAVSAELTPPPADRVRRMFARLSLRRAILTRGPYGIIVGLPTTFVIDRSGVVRYAASGALDRAALERLVSPLLR